MASMLNKRVHEQVRVRAIWVPISYIRLLPCEAARSVLVLGLLEAGLSLKEARSLLK